MSLTQIISALRLDLLASLLAAAFLGGAIGLERELRGKAAGLRTNILICIGAALFTQLSLAVDATRGDPARIAAQIVVGVGFLGAGTILHGRGAVTGLTSAATIWLVAAIGMAVGAGYVYEGAGATLLVLIVLRALGVLERFLQRHSMVSRLIVEMPQDPSRLAEIERLVRGAGVDIDQVHHHARGDHAVVELVLRGPRRTQEEARLALLRSSGAYTLTVEE
jgi:putative Mg2+ transporter-C (MgtC) family protein